MIRLTAGKIAVDPMLDPDTSPGGIIIPDMAKSKCDQGIVRYIGDDVTDIEVGDHVLFSAYSGTTVRMDGEGVIIILRAEFVVGVIHPIMNTEIPGLYFMDRGGEYWPATREMATRFIADAVNYEKSIKSINVKSSPSTLGRGI